MSKFINYTEKLIQNWEDSVLAYLPKVFLALVILFLFYFIAKYIKSLTLKIKVAQNHQEIASIISSIIYFFFILSGVFIALEVLGLEGVLTHLLAGAGIVGIVAGFAFKDVASNLFAGLILKTQHPFKKGDWVTINNSYGVIEEMGWITTIIHTVPGQEVFVPNQLIYNSSFTNFSTFNKRRIILESGVSYGDDLDHVKSVALDEVNNIEGLLTNEAIDFYFTEIGNSTYNFQLRFWIAFETNNDFRKAMSEAIMRIKKRFEQENICIAYPVTTLDFGVKGGVNLFDKSINIKS
jgi:small conductance mechanosensitive channel